MSNPFDPEAADETLVAAACDGNTRAFEALLRRHEGRVLRVLRLLGIPSSDREDVAQDVFLRIFRHLSGFHRGRPFSAWVYRVAVNAAHDHRSRVNRRRAEESPWPEALNPADGGRGAEESLVLDDLARKLESALATLSDRERAVFVLKEVEGLETVEVARTLGITSITVRRHLGLARSRLRRILSGERGLPADD